MMTDKSSLSQRAPASQSRSLAEVFHLVGRLIPEGQKVQTAGRDTTVAQAIEMMRQNNYSQLPVLAGDKVLGVFSYRSLAARVLEARNLTADVGQLPVEEFMERIHYAQPTQNWESILPLLNRDDAVLLGNRDALGGIITALDVLNYLHGIARPFVVLAEIEVSLRRAIAACVNADGLAECVEASLASKPGPGSLPETLEDMTFSDYAQIICHGRNWARFQAVFGQTEWQRKDTQRRLTEVRELRNMVFHFRRTLSDKEHTALAEHRDWLEMKTRAFEGGLASASSDQGTAVVEVARGKWNEASFFEELSHKHGPRDNDVARRLLEWVRTHADQIAWGQGKIQGSFVPVLTVGQVEYRFFAVRTTGTVEFYFKYLGARPPFDDPAHLVDLLERINAIDGVSLPRDAISRWPKIALSTLRGEAALRQFQAAFEWAIAAIRSH